MHILLNITDARLYLDLNSNCLTFHDHVDNFNFLQAMVAAIPPFIFGIKIGNRNYCFISCGGNEEDI